MNLWCHPAWPAKSHDISWYCLGCLKNDEIKCSLGFSVPRRATVWNKEMGAKGNSYTDTACIFAPATTQYWREISLFLLLETKLEQLERLRSDDTPAAPLLPTLLIHIRYQVKQDTVKGANIKELPKFQIWPTDAHTDRRTNRRTIWNQYTPFNFVEYKYFARMKKLLVCEIRHYSHHSQWTISLLGSQQLLEIILMSLGPNRNKYQSLGTLTVYIVMMHF